ncbi:MULTISPECIES: hypothetical protein [Natrialbaceae]|uniref:hypothetical protein n=1 Tax=Natrialbaceae TaxID=1644061 RepID=UPI00207C1324|nr:hypothetical protein [Natronococcus sp. CG52]
MGALDSSAVSATSRADAFTRRRRPFGGTLERVAALTDTYLATVNGVAYTVRTWRDRWV